MTASTVTVQSDRRATMSFCPPSRIESPSMNAVGGLESAPSAGRESQRSIRPPASTYSRRLSRVIQILPISAIPTDRASVGIAATGTAYGPPRNRRRAPATSTAATGGSRDGSQR